MIDFKQTIKAAEIVTLLNEAMEATRSAGQEFPCREFATLEKRIHQVYDYARSVRRVIQLQELGEEKREYDK